MIRRLLVCSLCLLTLSGCSLSRPAVSPSHSPAAVTPRPFSPPPASAAPVPGTGPSPSQTPAPEPYDYALPAPEREAVEDDWFADAVFLGDSRTDGLRLYGGVSQGDFICYKGLMCQDFAAKACIPLNGEKVTPQTALAQKQYGKVYVMLGLNELGFSVERFAEDYAALLDAIREVQPNAALYIQPVAPVNSQKAKEKRQPSYVTNEKISAFNAEIVRLAREKRGILVDVAQALADETGELPYEAATDGIHFTKTWYQTWFTYLKTHTVDPLRLEAAL